MRHTLIAAALGLTLTLGPASAFAEPAPGVNTLTQVEGGSTGDEGSASDDTCQGLAHMVNVLNDQAGSELQNHGNNAGRWHDLNYAINVVQDTAYDIGCYLVNPV
jgi:hypothetical protein